MERRVLIVEDDLHILGMLKTTLEAWGYRVETAEDGVAGLSQIEAFRPHLVVLDLVMPNLNGFEMLQELHKTDLPAAPILVMTGFADRFNEKILRADPLVLDILSKPLDLPGLAEKIKNALTAKVPA